MPVLKLTAAAASRLRSASSNRIDYFDEIVPGFGLRVFESGIKSWFVMTRINGKQVRITLGRHPTMALAEARAKAREAIEYASAGRDPRQVEQELRRARRDAARNTFRVASKEFITKHVERNLKSSTQREYRRALFGKDTAHWANRPVASISKRDVLDVLDQIRERGSEGAAENYLAYLRKFFSWCAEREIIEILPTERLNRSRPATSRDRTLSGREISIVWAAFKADQSLFGPLFKLLLLLGQRRNEIAGMSYNEINADLWTIPSFRTKNKLEHLVPLPRQATQIIESLRRNDTDLVFTFTGVTPVSGFGKAKARIDAWIAKRDEIQPWTLHDLRRTAVTMMNEQLGIAPHIIEAVVNHVTGAAKSGVAGVYNRAIYLDERQKALQLWADFVVKIANSVNSRKS